MTRFGREARADERTHELVCELGADDARAEHDDVHVVVLHALMRRVGVVADGRANAGDLAGGDRCANPAAADEHAAFRQAVRDGEAHGQRVIGIVDGLDRVRADVEHVVSVTTEVLDDVLLQGVARVVRADDDAHPLRIL